MHEALLQMIICDSSNRVKNDSTEPCKYTIEQLEQAIDTLAARVATLHKKADKLLLEYKAKLAAPLAIRICCEKCGRLHVDVGAFIERPHKSHTCLYCGLVWRPALFPTVGVQFLHETTALSERSFEFAGDEDPASMLSNEVNATLTAAIESGMGHGYKGHFAESGPVSVPGHGSGPSPIVPGLRDK